MMNMTIKAFISSLLITIIAAPSLFAEAEVKAPKGSETIHGTFVGIEDGKLVMKLLGQKYYLKFDEKTRIIGSFKKLEIDENEGIIKFTMPLAPQNHPQFKVQKKGDNEIKYSYRKLRDGWKEVNTGLKKRTIHIDAFTPEDLEPYNDTLKVLGFPEENNHFHAHIVYFKPVMDSFKTFDKNLPNLLNIGDSISLGYRNDLSDFCQGNINFDRPRGNCARVVMKPSWFGAYDEPGRHWDVIAFNGGHWNSSAAKEEYMAEFEESLKTCLIGARQVMWITTCPVPFGYNTDLKKNPAKDQLAIFSKDKWRSIEFACPGKVGRRPGRMMLQNYWVKPILDKYPQVAVCDQWGFVYNATKDENSKFADWMHGRNVHFSGELHKELAALVFELTMVMTGKKKIEDVPKQYRDFIHLSPKTYNPIADFDNPTPEAERYARPTAGKDDGAEKWWHKEEYRLEASVVNYDIVIGKTEEEKARNRVALAEKDLIQHEEWMKTNEVPEEQVKKALSILEYAKELASSLKKDKKKKGKKAKKKNKV